MLNKRTVILLLFIVTKFVMQYLLIDSSYNLHRDEYLHIDQGKHLAWGFDSVPPFTSWVSWIILHLGNTVFWVKFFPALFGVLTMGVVWKTVETLGGDLFALTLSALAILLSVLLRLNILYQPNSFDVLAWTLFYYCMVQFIKTESNQWLYYAALAFAVGFLNKYNIAFLVIGSMPAVLVTRFRRIFFNKHLYYALLLALLIISPNIVWQWRNDFPVIHHMNELSETQLVNVKRSDFLKEQLLFFISSLFIIVLAWLSFIVYQPHKKFIPVLWSFVFTLLLFIYLKAKGYYAIGLYPVFIAFGVVYLQKLLSKGWLRFLQPLAFLIPLLLSITFIRIAFPTAPPATIAANAALYKDFGLLRWEDGKDHNLPQDFADMLGWKELAAKVDSAYALITDKEHTLVFCDNYGMAGAVNYYSKYKNINAVSMNADYVDWFPPSTKELTNLILVQERNDDDPERKKEQPLFESVKLVGKIDNVYARENGTSIYLLQNAKVPIMHYFVEDIAKVKKRRSIFH
jgi:hypothetical protein